MSFGIPKYLDTFGFQRTCKLRNSMLHLGRRWSKNIMLTSCHGKQIWGHGYGYGDGKEDDEKQIARGKQGVEAVECHDNESEDNEKQHITNYKQVDRVPKSNTMVKEKVDHE